MPTRRMHPHRGDGEVWARGTDERMTHGELKIGGGTLGGEGAGGGGRAVRPRELCWRCDMKRHAPRRGRISHAFREICAHCAQWRVLNAADQRALGREAFVPAHKRPKQGDAPKMSAPEIKEAGARVPRRPRTRAAIERAEEKRDPYEAYEPPEITPVDEDEYRVDPNKDPLRDYTYWAQHEEALKKKKP